MKKWVLSLMVLAMLVAPMLACGIPLPAGNEMMSVSKAICAEGEDAAECQVRQDAYQLMGKLQTARVEDLAMYLLVDDGTEEMRMQISGNYDYVVVPATEGLGANVHAVLENAEITDEFGTQTYNDLQFMIVDGAAYSSEDGGTTWITEELDDNTMLVLGIVLGLGGVTGAGLDIYSDPGVFDVVTGDPVELNGQMMTVQTLQLDLSALLQSSDTLLALLQEGFAVGGEVMGLDPATLGMELDQLALIAGMMLPFLQGSELSTTIYIGQDDGYIYQVDDNFSIKIDMSALDPTQGSMEMTYTLTGKVVNHNGAITITAPAGATEGDVPGLFGGGGLGDSLFGGQ